MAIKQGEVKVKKESAIDERNLVDLMLQWEDHINQAAVLEQQIADITFEKKQTTKVGHVSASYFKETYVYDFESAGLLNASPEIKEKFTTVNEKTDWPRMVMDLVPHYEDQLEYYTQYEPTTDWKAVCKEADLTPAVIDTKPARVIVKLV